MNINGTDSDDDLTGSTGIDLIFGFAGNDTLRGGDGDDALFGGDGADAIYGGAGNDRLFGGAGNDILDGGAAPGETIASAGFNAAVYDFSDRTTAVDFPGAGPWFDHHFWSNQVPDGQGGMDSLFNIDALEIYGGSAGDFLSALPLVEGGVRVPLLALIEGNAGDDSIDALWSDTTVAFDTTRTDLGVDRIFSFDAQDRILLRNFDWDPAKPIGIGDGTALARGELQFGAYDATTNLTRVYVGVDDVAGADLVFDLSGAYDPAQFSRNDAGTDAYLVMDGGRTDFFPSTAPRNLQGTSANDTLVGASGDDTLAGNDGNDHLKGLAGNDLLDGGLGYDAAVYDFSASTTGVSFTATVDVAAPSSTQADGLGGLDTISNVESLEIFGGSASDTLTGGSTEDFIVGAAGNDVLTGGGGIDFFSFDLASATIGTDLITDLEDRDRITLNNFTVTQPVSHGDGTAVAQGELQFGAYDAATNTTAIYAGLDATAGADFTLLLQGQYDTTRFSSGSNGSSFLLFGLTPVPPPPPPPDPAQTFNGTSAADTFTGGTGNDTINGGAGYDTLMGNAGDDVIDGQSGNDRLFGDDGQDTVFGSLGSDHIEGGTGNDVLVGGDGNDQLWGDDGADWIQGDAGNDRLTGGAGDDFLVGGIGSDTLVGNAGADTFFFDSGTGIDRIDFFFVSHHDHIRIQANVNGSGILTAQDAYAHTTDTVDGALVDLGAGNTILLTGLHPGSFTAGIFEIV